VQGLGGRAVGIMREQWEKAGVSWKREGLDCASEC